MTNPLDIQVQLFNHLKNGLPPHLSLVSELSELLEISPDSVYRRMRGEKPVTLSELKVICEHYNLSLDQLLNLKSESIIFQAPGINGHIPDLYTYIQAMLQQFDFFGSFNNKQLFYLCKDVPFWYFFLFPEIAAFKSFFWSKTIINQASFANKLFSVEENEFAECIKAGQQVLQLYNKIPSAELWNLESIHSTINQLAYYKDAGIFKQREDFDKVIASFFLMLDHLQLQCEKGAKFLPGASPETAIKLEVYVNEIILGNNTILAELNDSRWAMVTYNVLNYLISKDERFVNKNFDSFNTLLERSALISKTGEKERHKFFNTLRDKLHILSR